MKSFILLAAFLPAILGASNWTPNCYSSNIGILYPDYNDNTYFYNCVGVNNFARTKCGAVNGVQQVFVYIYQFCTDPQYYIRPPTSAQIDSEINGGNNPSPSPSPVVPTLPTPKEDLTTTTVNVPTRSTPTTSNIIYEPSPTNPQPQTPDNKSTPPGPTGSSTTNNVPMPQTPGPTPPGPLTPPDEGNIVTPPINTPEVPQP